MRKLEPKYNSLCTEIRERCKADGVVLMVLGGELGSGFVIQADDNAQAQIPEFLEQAAAELRRQRIKRSN
jgi:hypothetical protein